MSSKKFPATSGPKTFKGKLLYHSHEESKKRIGDNPVDVVEKSVTHAEDNLFCKFYEKKNGKITKITVKASGGGPDAVIGEDKIPWAEVFAFCEGPGKTDWYVLEHETSKNPLDAVKRSFEALRKFGKV